MKRLLPVILIAFFASFNFTAQAQPTLTAANTNLRLGDQFFVNLCAVTAANMTTAAVTGANQTWNFSSLTSTMQQSAKVLARAAAPNPTSYPSANMVVKIDTDYEYVDNNNVVVKEYALVQSAQNNSLVNTDPANRISFPFTYNSTFTDAFAGTATVSGTTIPRNGNITVIANGYGTLVMPAGTFQNVLKVKATELANQLTPFAETSVTYDFFTPGIHFPLLRLTERTALGTTVYSGIYLDQSSLGLKEDIEENFGLQVYPNPASSEISISYAAEKAATVKISLQNMLGQEIDVIGSKKVAAGLQNEKLSLNAYPNGVYFIRVEMADKVAVKRLVIQ